MADSDPGAAEEIIEITHPAVGPTGRVARSSLPAWQESGWSEVTGPVTNRPPVPPVPPTKEP